MALVVICNLWRDFQTAPAKRMETFAVHSKLRHKQLYYRHTQTKKIDSHLQTRQLTFGLISCCVYLHFFLGRSLFVCARHLIFFGTDVMWTWNVFLSKALELMLRAGGIFADFSNHDWWTLLFVRTQKVCLWHFIIKALWLSRRFDYQGPLTIKALWLSRSFDYQGALTIKELWLSRRFDYQGALTIKA